MRFSSRKVVSAQRADFLLLRVVEWTWITGTRAVRVACRAESAFEDFYMAGATLLQATRATIQSCYERSQRT